MAKPLTLEEWLRNAGTDGLIDINIKISKKLCGTMGCFALRSFEVGDIIFRIPQNCIIGNNKALVSDIGRFLCEVALSLSLEESLLLSDELIFWLYMIQQRSDNNAFMHPYLYSLGWYLILLKNSPNLSFCFINRPNFTQPIIYA